MKQLICIGLIFSPVLIFAQHTVSQTRQQNKDSVLSIMAHRIQAPQSDVDSVFSVIKTYNSRLHSLALTKGIPNEEKAKKMRLLSDERDKIIARLMTPDQLQKFEMIKKYGTIDSTDIQIDR